MVGWGLEGNFMRDIAYDRYSMMIEGRREFIRSGAMHYFRLPSEKLWLDRLFKLKAAGYNCVDLYFCWDYHSPEQGVYDFSGIRDVRKLLQITQDLGLWVLARPGPYINAEYSGGGFPGWLLARKDLPLRNRREGAFDWSEEYMRYVREWYEQIIPIINSCDNILMMQIENEYATLEMEPEYMQALYQMARDLGVKVPLFHNDLYVAGLYADIVDIYAFDNYSVTQFETDWREMPEIFQVIDNVEANLRPFCENRPLMVAELQAGWYGAWKGWSYETITEYLGREHIGISTRSVIGQGLTIFNHYKAIGGTNWGFTGSTETYTSYDFGAPISEAGLNTERLFEAKALNYLLGSFDLTATLRRTDYPFQISDATCLYAVRSPADHHHSFWIWLRNLTYDLKKVTLDEAYEVEINPFEALILPYQVPLASGYRLDVSTCEVLYQNPACLFLKATRPVHATISAEDKPVDAHLSGECAGIQVVQSSQGKVSFHCHALEPDEFRCFQLGDLHVFLLGQGLADRFWVEESGVVVMGADERLADGSYGFAKGRTEARIVQPDGGMSVHTVPDHSGTLAIPELVFWEHFDEAPELSHPALAAEDFKPISSKGPDLDYNRLYEGSAWYRMPLDERPQSLEIEARHIWAVFLNGQLIGQGHQLMLVYGMAPPPPSRLGIPDSAWKPGGPNELVVFVNGMGHPKGFHDDAQTPEGLLSLKIDGEEASARLSIAGSYYSKRPNRVADPEALLPLTMPSPLVRLKTEFRLPETPQLDTPWGLQVRDMDFERINIYVNGILVGRYWRECQRQNLFYLPAGLLKEPGEKNSLEVVVMNFDPYVDEARLAQLSGKLSLVPYGVFTKWQRKDTLDT